MMLQDVLPAYESFLRDESRLVGQAGKIAFPTDAGMLAEALEQAHAQNLAVTVQGARTGLVGGAAPRGGLAINLSKMSRILGKHQEKDCVLLRAEAGATLDEINAEARGEGYFFAPNPTEGTATIGGIYTSGAAGPSSLRFGQTSFYVQALRWLTPKGDVWDVARGEYVFDAEGCALPYGGRLTCNTGLPQSPVAACIPRPGTDLIDFLAGSEGKLGIAAEFELRLLPKPAEVWGLLFFFEDEAQAFAFAPLLQVWQQGEGEALLTAAEYYDNASLTCLAAASAQNSLLKGIPAFPQNGKAAIYLELGGNEADALETALYKLLEHFAEAGGDEESTWAVSGETEVARLRSLRHVLPELAGTLTDEARLAGLDTPRLETDFTGPPEKFADYVNMYHTGMRQAGVEGFVYGHLLQNRIHAALLPKTEQQLSHCEALVQQWAGQVAADGGLLASENGVGQLKLALIQEFLPEGHKQLFCALKVAFDPENRMGSF